MEWISNWAEAIIIAVIIGTIIEMILPEGSSKKYIKVVVGVYILFTIISPVITKFSGKTLQVSDVLDLDKYIEEIEEKQTVQNLLQEENSASIRDIYAGNLKADIQNKLKGKGYNVTSINLDVGYDDNYTLHQIKLSADKEENTNKEEEEENITNIDNSENTVNIQAVNEISINISNTVTENKAEEKSLKSNLSNNDKNKIKEYLSSVYEINEDNIVID